MRRLISAARRGFRSRVEPFDVRVRQPALAHVLILVVALAGSYFFAHYGPLTCAKYAGDQAVLLDGGWRVFQGQRPHVDFYTPLGPVTHLMFALAMHVGQPSARALAYVTAGAFSVLTLWAWLVAASRLPAGFAMLFSLFVGFMWASAHPLGHGIADVSYAMKYNRLGMAIWAIVVLETSLRPLRAGRKRDDYLGGLSTGVLIAVLLFLKLNYFVGAVIVTAAAWLCFPRNARWTFSAMLGATIVTLAMLGYLRFDIAAIAGDLRMAGGARSRSFNLTRLGSVSEACAFSMLLVFVAWELNCVGRGSGGDAAFARPRLFSNGPPTFERLIAFARDAFDRVGRPSQAMLALWAGSVLAAGLMVVMLNYQSSEIGVYPVASLVIVEYARRRELTDDRSESFFQAARRHAAALLAVGWLAVTLCWDVAGANYAAGRMIDADQLTADRVALQAEPLRCLAFEGPTVAGYLVVENDGLRLLRKHVRPEDRVFAMEFSNVYSFALQQPSPRGDAAWWDFGNSFDGVYHPPAEKAFGDVTLVMTPKTYPQSVLAARIGDLYEDYLTQNFEPCEESTHWRLHARKSARPALAAGRDARERDVTAGPTRTDRRLGSP